MGIGIMVVHSFYRNFFPVTILCFYFLICYNKPNKLLYEDSRELKPSGLL